VTRIGSVNIASAVKELTLEVDLTGVRVFKARVMLAKPLIWLAAKVIGCGLKIYDLKVEK
jgi:hypothetical protein